MKQLRPYQEEDVARLLTQPAMGIFNEQRTGKTPTAIICMQRKNVKKLVIICPASAVLQWKEEYEAWTGEKATAILGTKQKKQNLLQEWETGAVIISYGSFKTTKVSEGLVDILLKKKPEGIIVDEAHRIKDRKSAASKAILRCVRIPNRLALTGTPATNHQEDIFQILKFIDPKTFSSYWRFIEEYFNSYKMRNKQGQEFTNITGINKNKLEDFQKILTTLSIQRKRKEVMNWLPDKDYKKIILEPTKEQIRYLDELKNFFETEHIITENILERLIRYRQICLHPNLLELKSKSPKLEWIKDYVSDYPDTPTIIFSKFTSFIKILDKELESKKVGVIIGETTISNRNKIKLDFQAGRIKTLLINIDAGKEALTLDKAEAVIFADKYPPVADIQQAEDRFVATTKDKANKAHTIYELILKDTYDEQIYKLLKKNASEIDVLNDYKKYLERRDSIEK